MIFSNEILIFSYQKILYQTQSETDKVFLIEQYKKVKRQEWIV